MLLVPTEAAEELAATEATVVGEEEEEEEGEEEGEVEVVTVVGAMVIAVHLGSLAVMGVVEVGEEEEATAIEMAVTAEAGVTGAMRAGTITAVAGRGGMKGRGGRGGEEGGEGTAIPLPPSQRLTVAAGAAG